jgi:hypothetical protein
MDRFQDGNAQRSHLHPGADRVDVQIQHLRPTDTRVPSPDISVAPWLANGGHGASCSQPAMPCWPALQLRRANPNCTQAHTTYAGTCKLGQLSTIGSTRDSLLNDRSSHCSIASRRRWTLFSTSRTAAVTEIPLRFK